MLASRVDIYFESHTVSLYRVCMQLWCGTYTHAHTQMNIIKHVCVYYIRTLHTSVAKHAGGSTRTDSILTVPAQLMIRNDARKCNNCSIDLDNFNIIGRMNNLINLVILESLLS